MNRRALRGNLLLILTALIWGAAFVAQRMGLDHLGSFAFNGLRTLIGAFCVLPVALWGRNRAEHRGNQRTLILGGICCGLVMFAASNLQQAGLQYTSVGKAGFITALYILIVPLIGLLMGKRVSRLFWIAVAVAVMGMFLLTMRGGAESVSKGDLLVLASAALFAAHILVIDHFSPKVDGVMMAAIQFFISGALSLLVAALLGDEISWSAVRGALWPMLYSGVLSCGVGYTLQIIAQKDVDPVVASLLMSLESVFAVLAGWAVLGQAMSGRELIGCGLVFAAIILAQLPERRLESSKMS